MTDELRKISDLSNVNSVSLTDDDRVEIIHGGVSRSTSLGDLKKYAMVNGVVYCETYAQGQAAAAVTLNGNVVIVRKDSNFDNCTVHYVVQGGLLVAPKVLDASESKYSSANPTYNNLKTTKQALDFQFSQLDNLSSLLGSNIRYGFSTTATEIDRFAPLYWRIDGPRSMSFAITTYGNGFEAYFISRKSNDFCGIIWDSEDKKDHHYLGYATNKDYTNCIWTFDIELSATMPVLNDPQRAATLTVEGRNAAGANVVYYIALFNYANNPSSRSASITINWNTVKAGFGADQDVYIQDIDRIFFGGITSSYDGIAIPGGGTNPPTVFSTPIISYIRMTNSVISGSNSKLAINKISVPPHDVGISTSYDDHYDLNPDRIIENIHQLGYRGWINHYVGMSTYPSRYWDVSQQRFIFPVAGGSEPLVNEASAKWHLKLALACKSKNYRLIQAVSYEIFSEYARLDWTQRDWNDQYGRTGYTPPSYFISHSHVTAMNYLRQVFVEFATIANTAGLAIYMQIGEPWWWFNGDGKPCIYDNQTKLDFNAATGLSMADFGTINSTQTGAPYDQMKTFLRDRLGESVQSCRTAVRNAFPSAKVCVLFFLPSILDDSVGIMKTINYPQTQYSFPNFDFMMTEVYDWIITAQLDKSYEAMERPIYELGYHKDDVQYLAGFVPDPVLAPLYGLSGDSYKHEIWQRIFGNMKNNARYGIRKQHIWAYPQVMSDSITIVDQLDGFSFYMGDNLVPIIRDDTPYLQAPEPNPEIPGPGAGPGENEFTPTPTNELKPFNIIVRQSSWGDIRIDFSVQNETPNITYDVRIYNGAGTTVLWNKVVSNHFVYFPIDANAPLNLTNSQLTIAVVPSSGIPSTMVVITPTQTNDFVSKVIAFCGQSNALAHSTTLSGAGGRHDLVSAFTMRETVAQSLGIEGSEVMPVFAAWSSSVADKLADDDPVNGVNYWYNVDTSSNGPRLTQALAILTPFASKIIAVIWAQGENDAIAYSAALPRTSNTTRYTTATNAILNALAAILQPSVKFVWQILGRSYYGDSVLPGENTGVVWQIYRNAQRAIINARTDSILGSWISGAERLSGYTLEGVGAIHYTNQVYQRIAADAAQSVAATYDRITQPPTWVDMVAITGPDAINSSGNIVVSWTAGGYTKFQVTQINVLDGSTIYQRIVNSPTDTFTTTEQTTEYGYTTSTVLIKIAGYDLAGDVAGPAISFTKTF